MATSVASLDSSLVKDADVERVFRKFTFKCLQIIVQSRIENPSISHGKDSSHDYFSITLPDSPSVEDRIKQTLEGIKSYPVKDQSICVEIPLVTNDGEHMFLETWDLTFNLSSLDVSASKIQHIFTRMGLTLKSLLCATRATPAFRLAKNQGEKGGGYVLNYRFYLGKPRTHMLGEGYKSARAGAVPTAYGLYTINVAYRTKLLLSPEMAASASSSMELTDNYFMKEYGPKTGQSQQSDPQPCSPRLIKTSSLSSPEHHGDSPYCFAVSPSPRSSNEHLSTSPAKDPSNWPLSSILNLEELPEPTVGAFSKQRPNSRTIQDKDVPFEGLMKRSMVARLEHQEKMEHALQIEGKELDRLRGPDTARPQNKDREEEKENVARPNFFLSQAVDDDDYVMVDKPPFAIEEDPRDVKVFLGTIMRAPKNLYDVPDAGVTVNDYLEDVGMMVSQLEADMPVLDEFCQSVINFHSTDEEDGSLFS